MKVLGIWTAFYRVVKAVDDRGLTHLFGSFSEAFARSGRGFRQEFGFLLLLLATFNQALIYRRILPKEKNHLGNGKRGHCCPEESGL